jgi:hypothetical protein
LKDKDILALREENEKLKLENKELNARNKEFRKKLEVESKLEKIKRKQLRYIFYIIIFIAMLTYYRAEIRKLLRENEYLRLFAASEDRFALLLLLL